MQYIKQNTFKLEKLLYFMKIISLQDKIFYKHKRANTHKLCKTLNQTANAELQ